MLLNLSLLTHLFIWKRLKDAGVKKIITNIFLLFFFLCVITAYVVGYDYHNPAVDIFPGRWCEVLRGLVMTWTIITIIALCAIIFVDAVTLFMGFTKKKLFFALAITFAGTLYGIFEAYYVTPRYVEISTGKLPDEIKSLRVAFLTDVHIGGLSTYWHFSRVMKIVEDANPDILLLGGDILDGKMNYRERELELLRAAASRAKYGAFAVNGNHEYYWILDEDVEKIISDLGIKMLVNERAEIPGLVIVGIDDVKNGWLKIFLEPDDAKKFVLVLKHRPGLPFDADGNFDLQLSGHTHGGQFWPLGYFKDRVANSTQGLSEKGGGFVYVSNGSGFNGPMMRLFVPPEVTIIDIVKEK